MESTTGWARVEALLGDRAKLVTANVLAMPKSPRARRRKTGQRCIRGGRATVPKALYMATLVATRHNPVIHDYYQHLQQQGKPRKVALIACIRKLLIRLNALMAETQND